jgi:hypothetical protein
MLALTVQQSTTYSRISHSIEGTRVAFKDLRKVAYSQRNIQGRIE